MPIPMPDVPERRAKRFPSCTCFNDAEWRSFREASIEGLAKEAVSFILKKMDDYTICKKAGSFVAGQIMGGLAQYIALDAMGNKPPNDVDALTKHFLAVSMELDDIAEHARDLVEVGGRKFIDAAKKK